MVETNKQKQKLNYDKNSLNFELQIGDQVLPQNDVRY